MRFPGFEGDWEVKKLGELLEFKNGINASKEQYGKGVKFINVLDILNNDFITYENIIGKVDVDANIIEKFSVQYGDILFQRSSETREEVGTANVYLDKTNNATFGGFVIRGKKVGDYNPIFFNKLLKTNSARESITSKSGGSTRFNVGQEILSSIVLCFPTLLEQQKIASFLSLIDERITTQKKIIKNLESLIQSFREKIFSRKLRFRNKESNVFPNWERMKLKNLATRLTDKNTANNKNVLTISAQYGLISQLDFFNKSVSAKNVTGYYLLDKNDFAYNKSYSNGYPMGAIKKLINYEKGVVSTLYICFRFHSNVNSDYMKHYFDSGFQNVEIEKIAQEGARNHGLLNIGINDFFNIEIYLPSIEEKGIISNFLSKIENKIGTEKKILAQYKSQKNYLLSNLFI